jgi:hypothetical protein
VSAHSYRASTVGAAHGHRTDPAIAEVLLHFADEAAVLAFQIKRDLDGVVDFWQFAGGGEIDVHDGADDLNDSCRCCS